MKDEHEMGGGGRRLREHVTVLASSPFLFGFDHRAVDSCPCEVRQPLGTVNSEWKLKTSLVGVTGGHIEVQMTP